MHVTPQRANSKIPAFQDKNQQVLISYDDNNTHQISLYSCAHLSLAIYNSFSYLGKTSASDRFSDHKFWYSIYRRHCIDQRNCVRQKDVAKKDQKELKD
jgi:hypothetical protein